MRIGVDLDGVIYDFTTAAQQSAKLIYGRDFPAPTVWNFPHDEWGMTWPEWFQFVAHASVGYKLWSRIPMAQSVQFALWGLVANGHTIHYITHRHPLGAEAQFAARWQTEHWLNDAPGVLRIVENAADKAPLARQLGLDIFIEDNVENAAQLNNTGILCHLIARPWNDHAHGGYKRYPNFESFAANLTTDAGVSL